MPLVVGGNVINKISGPVSMYILIPKANMDFPNLPVYMLFGDVHNSNENMCKEESEGKGEYKIYDLELLKILNKLGSEKEPIDFYVEGGDFHNKECDEDYSENYSMQKLWNLYIECYKKKKIAKYRYKTACDDISNIRWQSGDARYFDDDKRSASLNCNIKRMLGVVDFSVESKDRHLMLIEAAKEFFEENEGCSKKILNKKSLKFDFSFEEELLLLKKKVLDKNGLIYKQLKKIRPRARSLMIEYIEKYCEYTIKEQFRINKDTLNDFKKIHIDYITYIDEWFKDGNINKEFFDSYLQDENWKKLQSYYVYLSETYKILLDIYTLCRSFKYLNSKSPNPIMNIVYTGNSHTEGIIYFLDDISGLYTVKNIQDFNIDSVIYLNKPVNRCVDIKLKLDLDKILEELKLSQPMRQNVLESKSIKAKSRKAKSRKAKSRKAKSMKAKSRKVKSRKARSRKAKSRKGKSRKAKSRKAKSRKAKSRKAKSRKAKSRKAKSRKGRPRGSKNRKSKNI